MIRRYAVPIPAAVLCLTLSAGVALAADISIAVGAPETVAVGDHVEVKAIVTSGGDPVEGAIVVLTYKTSFAGVDGRVELDEQTTGADGIAILTYEQRSADNGEMSVAYHGPEDIAVEPFVFTIGVEPGGERQEVPDTGVQIPFLDSTLVILIIGTVWVLLAYAAIQLVLIGRSTGGPTPKPRLTGQGSESGSAWLSVILAAAVIITAAGMIVVLSRNPLTQAETGVAGGYDRTPIAYIEIEYPYVGHGLADPSIADTDDPIRDGRLLYFQYGCTGCHGLTGFGAAVAPELKGEVGSSGAFQEDVRDGPKNMPGYVASVLSDEELAKMHRYLDEDS